MIEADQVSQDENSQAAVASRTLEKLVKLLPGLHHFCIRQIRRLPGRVPSATEMKKNWGKKRNYELSRETLIALSIFITTQNVDS